MQSCVVDGADRPELLLMDRSHGLEDDVVGGHDVESHDFGGHDVDV